MATVARPAREWRTAASPRTRRRRAGRSHRWSRSRRRTTAATSDDQFVAGVVAEGVVDLLEVVEVQHEQRTGLPVAGDGGDLPVRVSASKLRRFASPVSGSWSARCWSWDSNRLRSVMSRKWLRKYSGRSSASRTTVDDDATQIVRARRRGATASRCGTPLLSPSTIDARACGRPARRRRGG